MLSENYDGLTTDELEEIMENVLDACEAEECKNSEASVDTSKPQSLQDEQKEKFEALLVKYEQDYKKSLFEFCFEYEHKQCFESTTPSEICDPKEGDD